MNFLRKIIEDIKAKKRGEVRVIKSRKATGRVYERQRKDEDKG